MKVNIPKNLWLSSADADFYREGYFSGVYGLTLHFTGKSLDSIDIMTEILEPLTQVPLPRRKIVRFEGLFDPKDQYISLALEAFKSWGFLTQAVIPISQADLSWRPKLDWLILTTSSPFVPIASNELWYYPKPAESTPENSNPEILEPRLPPTDPAICYLAKGYSVAQTTRFIINSKYNWSIL